MIVQTLRAIPHGVIQSGEVSAKADEKTGEIDFSDSLVVGWAFFNKTIHNDGVYKIDPAQLLSAAIKVGTTMQVGSVKLEVISIDSREMATVTISFDDGQGNKVAGTILADLSGTYWHITYVDAKGTIQGTDVHLELEP